MENLKKMGEDTVERRVKTEKEGKNPAETIFKFDRKGTELIN